MLLESLSNDDGDGEDDAQSKMNLHFTSEIRNCLDLFSTPIRLNIRNDSVQFQMEIQSNPP